MKANSLRPGIAKYTQLKYKYKREEQARCESPKPRYGQPAFPYTYKKNARVSFLNQIQVIQYKEIEPPTPREVPIPYSLLSEVQLIWLLSRVR